MSWRQRRRWIVALPFVLMSLMISPVAAQDVPSSTPANEPVPRFNIQPVGDYPEGFFSVTLSPGESIGLTAAVVTTDDSAPVSLRAYGTNAINAVNGGFAAGTDADTLTGAATWVDFPAQSLDLGPDARVEIPFTVTVPADTAPGQYVAALVAQTDGPIPIPGMDTFNQVVRSALGITIVVPGLATYGFEMGEPELVETSVAQISIPITNTGNYLVRPVGWIELATPEGQSIASLPVEMRAVYGGLTADLLITLPGPLGPGEYVVSGTLTDADSGVSATTEPVTVAVAEPEVEQPGLAIESAAVAPVGNPVQYVDVAVLLVNDGELIPAANVTLNVSRDGEPVEQYPLAQNQAIPTGTTTISQRYIPAGGWSAGTYTFTIEVAGSSLETGGDIVLGSTTIETEIVIP